jgi:hypothetical protein
MEPEDSLPSSQQPTTCFYWSLINSYSVKIHFNIILIYMSRLFKCSFSQFLSKTFYALKILSHACYMSSPSHASIHVVKSSCHTFPHYTVSCTLHSPFFYFQIFSSKSFQSWSEFFLRSERPSSARHCTNYGIYGSPPNKWSKDWLYLYHYMYDICKTVGAKKMRKWPWKTNYWSDENRKGHWLARTLGSESLGFTTLSIARPV